MFLSVGLANYSPNPNAVDGVIEQRIDTIIHELAHLLEEFRDPGDSCGCSS